MSGMLANRGEHANRRQVADRIAHLHHGAQHAAALLGRVLDHHQHRAAPLAAEADALEEAKGDEQDRRRDADLGVGRQQADQEGAQPHDDDGDGEHRLAADAIAEMAEDGSAQRPGEKADAIVPKPMMELRAGSLLGKNSLLKTSVVATA